MSVSGAFRSFKRKLTSTYTSPAQVKNAVIGAVSNIDQLLDVINEPSASSSDKVTAAGLLRASLDVKAVSSVQEVWQRTRSLLELENQAEVRQAGWRLTLSCIEHDDVNVGAFNAYYYTIVEFSNTEDFHLILNCLNALTQGGKRLASGQVAVYRLPTVLISWIQLLALRSEELRSNPNAKDVSEPWGTSTPENFHALLQYTINTVKFNMTAYDEEEIEKLLMCAVAIIRNTSSVEDIKLSCNIFDTIMAFGIIPLTVLPQVLQVLCGVTLIDEELSVIGYRTIENLAQSHLANSTVVGISQILHMKDSADITNRMRIGAVRVLVRLINLLAQQRAQKEDKGDENKQELRSSLEMESGDLAVPIEEVLSAYAHALEYPSRTLAVEVAQALFTLIHEPVTYALLDYDIWQSTSLSPFNIIFILADVLKPTTPGKLKRSGFRAGSNAAIESPASIPLNGNQSEQQNFSKQQLSRDLVGLLGKIMGLVLKRAMEPSSPIPIDDVLHVSVEFSEYLDEESLLKVLDTFFSMHYCSPYQDDWDEKLDLLLTHMYVRSGSPSSLRVSILSKVRDIYLIVIGTDATMKLTPITRRLLSIVSVSDGATMDALLDLYEFLVLRGSWDLFELATNILINVFPDQSAKAVVGSVEESARNAKIARKVVDMFTEIFFTVAKRARFLYYTVVQMCRLSVHDLTVFREGFALLSRLVVDKDLFVIISEPSLEPDYGKINSLQAALRTREGLFDRSSLTLKRMVSLYEIEEELAGSQMDDSQYSIDPSLILSLVINVLQGSAADGVFALVLLNLPAQLSDIQFFYGCEGELITLRNALYSQVGSGKLPIEVKLDGVTKQDLLSIEIHSLAILLGYSRIFQKPDHDKLVQTLVMSMNQWDRTANWSLHCLVVCCYECPSSVQRFLPQILSKLQTKISTNEASTHILEFLWTLCLVESLTDNFNMQEFKRVFGICFSYIQHAHDILAKSKAETDVGNSILSQYLLRLAYSSIMFLFLAIDINSRPEIVPYLIRSLVLADGNKSKMALMSYTAYDFVCRYAYANQPLSLSSRAIELSRISQSSEDDVVDTRRYIVGSSIFEVSTSKMLGKGTMIYRRPTGTMVVLNEPALLGKTDIIRSQAGLGEVPKNFSPNFWMLQMHGLQEEVLNVIPIPNDTQSNRTIATLDRAPVVDFHKVGIIYIAPGQTKELEILSNTTGSRPYRKFLGEIGRLVRLKNNREIYAGGLDTEVDTDGKYTYGWRGKISQIIFHVTSMMPTHEHDTEVASKKRHIGNNFVNIYYNESGLEFDFDTVKSQFNFINIVITPTAMPGQFRVRAYRKPGLANVLAAYERKVISEKQLPLFVRHLALKASQYATVYNQHGEYTDNWLYRLDLIEKLKARLLKQRAEDEEKSVQESGQAENGPEMELLHRLDFSAALGDAAPQQ